MAASEMGVQGPLKDFILTFVMPEKCYDHFFVHFNFAHVPCLMLVLNSSVGLWVMLGTMMAQLPQVYRILSCRRAEGLSLPSVLLLLYAHSAPVVYCVVNSFPLSAWGDRLFMLKQSALTSFLILHYRGHTLQGLLLLLTYSGVMFLLCSYGWTAANSKMEAFSMALVIASKVIQARTTYSIGHKGQLSSLSVFLVWLGSWALTFVSVQETGLSLYTMVHMLSAFVSCVQLAQVLWYRNTSSSTSSTTRDKQD
ncbi:mannose-P-dolichol utilization defect 1 protein-like [Lampris incognitus]|uniref:mannose-P-dolichol utilization defect 1 protein-like n=1 Tax=Lampris incognitus TaxID=2546036 RepID=UPI0024B5D1F6|nr:mannose-P-dolichol utilization defect 1 protein-like [Lampris incognitus]